MRHAPFLAVLLCYLTGNLAGGQSGSDSITTEETQMGAWLMRCISRPETGRACSLSIGLVDPLTPDRQGALRIFPVPPEERLGQERFAAQLATPTHVLLREGIQVQIDQTTIQTEAYEVCSYRQCISTFAVSEALLEELSTGFAGTIRLVDAGGQEVRLNFALEGFADGLALLEQE